MITRNARKHIKHNQIIRKKKKIHSVDLETKNKQKKRQ